MKKLLSIVILGIAAYAEPIVFASGAQSKTFFQIANNIKSISPTPLDVRTTKGSVENLVRLANNEAGIGLTFADAYYQFKKAK